MRILAYVLLSALMACAQDKKYHDQKVAAESSPYDKVQAILDFQSDLNEKYKDPEESPLPDRIRSNFEGLPFFKADTNYVVVARLQRTPNAVPFLMPTTTDRMAKEVVYGILEFELNGKTHELEVYQSPDLIQQEEYKDHLFLPFTDLTNGEETYGGGRYVDLSLQEGGTMVIDFNRAYNPYCAYNKKYSCPIVPQQNFLDTKVLAGVKAPNKK